MTEKNVFEKAVILVLLQNEMLTHIVSNHNSSYPFQKILRLKQSKI